MSQQKKKGAPQAGEMEDIHGVNRSMPFSDEAERGVISGLLHAPERISEVRLQLEDGAFFHIANRIVYDQLLEFDSMGVPLDIHTLTDALRAKETLGKVGGPGAIAEYFGFIPVSTHFDFYIKQLQDKHLLRQTIERCAITMDACYSHGSESIDEDPLKVVMAGEQQLFQLVEKGQARGSQKSKIISMPQMLPRWVERLEHVKNMRGKINGLQTGWVDVDRAFGGLGTDPKGDLCILAGFPGMGKSVAAASVVESFGLVQGVPGLYLPLEMGVDGAMDRFGLGVAGVDTSKARNGFFSNRDFDEIQGAFRRLREAPIYWWEGSFIECTELRALAQIMKRKCDIKWLLLDHMGQIKASTAAGRSDPIKGQIEIMETLHSIRHDFGLTIVLCVQLTKAASEKRPSQPKQLSDLRGASEIGEYATHCLFIDRPIQRRPWTSLSDEQREEWDRMTSNYAREVPAHWASTSPDGAPLAYQHYKEHAVLAIAKNRHGATPDHICVRFQASIQRFTNRSPTLYSNNPNAQQVVLHGF